MKYTIHGFSQEQAINLKLDSEDLLLLRWFVDFHGTNKMQIEIIDKQPYYWVYYPKVIKDMPIITSKEDTIYRKFKKLVKENVLKIYTKREKSSNGKFKTFSFYAFDKNYDKLVGNFEEDTKDSDNKDFEYSENNPSDQSENNPSDQSDKNPYKDSSINNSFDSSITITTTTQEKNVVVDPLPEEDILKKEIESRVGHKIYKKGFDKLLKESNPETIRYYLEHWQAFTNNMTEEEKAAPMGIFINTCIEKRSVPKEGHQIKKYNFHSNRGGFEQRTYSDEFYEGLYNYGPEENVI